MVDQSDLFRLHLCDGNVTTFVIDDVEVHPDFSTVIVNTIQDNFVICVIDYLWSGAFEINCNVPPADGAQLKYTVINLYLIEVGYPRADELVERYENLIGALSPPTRAYLGTISRYDPSLRLHAVC